MKKQILALTMCLALTATSALANCTAECAKKAPAKACACAVKPVACQKAASETTLTPEQMAKKKFEEKFAKDRQDLYCQLGLSAEQKTKAEALDQKNMVEAQPLFAKIREEKAKLKELKCKNACPGEICKQKMAVKSAKKALKAHMKASKQAFDSLLTKDQLAKLNTIREQRKKDMAKHKCDCKCKCHHHHHEFGPESMGPMPAASPAPQCPCECK